MPFPIDEKYILETEEKISLTFPESFRKKMMVSNGGEVETPPDAWELYPFWDKSNKKRLSRTCNDIIRETDSSRKWVGFPEKAIAIGANGGGDKLIFLQDEKNPNILAPQVYWWDHETGSTHIVANDFNEL